jgi:hypothetical protein
MIPLDQNQKEENPKSVKIRKTDIVFYTLIGIIATVLVILGEVFRH